MAKVLKSIFLLFILVHFQQISSAEDKKKENILLNMGNVKKVVHMAVQEVANYFNFLNQPTFALELFAKFFDLEVQHENEDSKELHKISQKIDDLTKHLLRFEDNIMNKLDQLFDKKDLTQKLDMIYDHIDQIDSLYHNYYLKYVDGSIVLLDSGKESFAKDALRSREYGINQRLDTVKGKLLNGTGLTKNVPTYYAEDSSLSRLLVCQMKQSAQRLIFSIYELIIMAELKGIAVLAFAAAYLKDVEQNPGAQDFELSRDRQIKRLNETFYEIKKIAATARRDIWPCDSDYKIDAPYALTRPYESTYEKFTPFLQKFVMWEGDVAEVKDPRFVSESYICASDCPSITNADKIVCNPQGGTGAVCLDSSQKFNCSGSVHDCDTIDNAVVCTAYLEDPRRYRKIQIGSDIYGEGEACESDSESGHRYNITGFSGLDDQNLFKSYRCDYCLCTCEVKSEDSRQVHAKFFSLRNILSDDRNNKVITGVRIVRKGELFHIEIEEGELLPKGLINHTSVTWKREYGFSRWYPEYTSGVDYHEVSWDHRTFFLDDLESKEGHVLTGIRFMLDENKNIKLAIRTAPFDSETGMLKVSESVWQNNTNGIREREELKLAKYGIPINHYQNEIDSKTNQFINLTTSSLEDDVGQSVVPFIDTQRVNSLYPMPLAGAGLIHKGNENSAGFLALKIITYDINKLSKNPN